MQEFVKGIAMSMGASVAILISAQNVRIGSGVCVRNVTISNMRGILMGKEIVWKVVE